MGGQWPLNFFGLTAASPFEMAQLTLTPQSPFNPFNSDDPTVTDLLTQASSATGDAQADALQQLSGYLVDQAWFAPWDAQEAAAITSEGVDVTPDPRCAVPAAVRLRPGRQLTAGSCPRCPRGHEPPSTRPPRRLTVPLFLLRRLGAGVALLWVTATLTFFLTNLTGADPARRILGTNATLDAARRQARGAGPGPAAAGPLRRLAQRRRARRPGGVVVQPAAGDQHDRHRAAGLALPGHRRRPCSPPWSASPWASSPRFAAAGWTPCSRRSRSSPSRCRTSSSPCCWPLVFAVQLGPLPGRWATRPSPRTPASGSPRSPCRRSRWPSARSPPWPPRPAAR